MGMVKVKAILALCVHGQRLVDIMLFQRIFKFCRIPSWSACLYKARISSVLASISRAACVMASLSVRFTTVDLPSSPARSNLVGSIVCYVNFGYLEVLEKMPTVLLGILKHISKCNTEFFLCLYQELSELYF